MSETTSDREILALVSSDGDCYEVSLYDIPFWAKWICVDEEGHIVCHDATGERKQTVDHSAPPKGGKELSWEMKMELKSYAQQADKEFVK